MRKSDLASDHNYIIIVPSILHAHSNRINHSIWSHIIESHHNIVTQHLNGNKLHKYIRSNCIGFPSHIYSTYCNNIHARLSVSLCTFPRTLHGSTQLYYSRVCLPGIDKLYNGSIIGVPYETINSFAAKCRASEEHFCKSLFCYISVSWSG